MVCMGNICRSPMAQVVANTLAANAQLAKQLSFDSAGTYAGHAGEPPDPRTQAALQRRGYKPGRSRARRITAKDFERYELILAMDRDNLAALEKASPPEHRQKIRLFLEFAPALDLAEVPDPYYGGPDGFERVLDLCEAAARGLLGTWPTLTPPGRQAG